MDNSIIRNYSESMITEYKEKLVDILILKRDAASVNVKLLIFLAIYDII